MLELGEVAGHEAAIQASVSLARQAAAGDRLTPDQLQQAAQTLQVCSSAAAC